MYNARWTRSIAIGLFFGLVPASVVIAGGPFLDGRFHGRIACSCDGNHNDPDTCPTKKASAVTNWHAPYH